MYVLQYIKSCILFSLVRRVIIGDERAGILSGGYPDRLEACDPTDRFGTILKKNNPESGKSGPGRNAVKHSRPDSTHGRLWRERLNPGQMKPVSLGSGAQTHLPDP